MTASTLRLSVLAPARQIFFGNLGKPRQGVSAWYGGPALRLELEPRGVVNTVYIDAAVKKLQAGGMTIPEAIRARLSPLQFDHINFHGRYPMARPNLAGQLRPLRDPNAGDK